MIFLEINYKNDKLKEPLLSPKTFAHVFKIAMLLNMWFVKDKFP